MGTACRPLPILHLLSGNNQKEEAVQTLEKLLARKVEFSDRKKAEELLADLTKG
jgi:hypothetical protein